MKRTLLLAVAASLALPGAAMAQTPSPTENASKACKAERAAMGADVFKATYGTNKNKSNAHGKCVSKRTKGEKANIEGAAATCKAERAADPAAFAVKYGTNKNGKNAYGKCVSSLSKEASAEDTEANVNAAKTCKAERKLDPAAFKDKYGANKKKSNAFGKCVSQTAKAQEEEPAPTV
jgi:hypothetical protein